MRPGRDWAARSNNRARHNFVRVTASASRT